MTAKFTLISFLLNRGMLVDDRKQPTNLAVVLESTTEKAAMIYLGAYVFETQRDWPNMHRLCEALLTLRHPFLRIPFDGELSAFTDMKDAEAEDKGLTLLRYPE